MKLRLSERVLNREWARLPQKVSRGEIDDDEFTARLAMLKVELRICYLFRFFSRVIALEIPAYLACLRFSWTHPEVLGINILFLVFCGTWTLVEGYRKLNKMNGDLASCQHGRMRSGGIAFEISNRRHSQKYGIQKRCAHYASTSFSL